MDIANHIISSEGMRLPISYADTFKVLMENNIITRDLFRTMERMAKSGNIIVHQYEKIEPAIIVSILKKHLKDFERYKKAIKKSLLDK